MAPQRRTALAVRGRYVGVPLGRCRRRWSWGAGVADARLLCHLDSALLSTLDDDDSAPLLQLCLLLLQGSVPRSHPAGWMSYPLRFPRFVVPRHLVVAHMRTDGRMQKLRKIWSSLRTSFWFVPSLIVAFSVALATVLVEADAHGGDELAARWPRLFGAGAEGARGMLSTIASSMMSVVGVTFSMTLVALSLASSQYSSRILRNFMGSRVTQVCFGIFSGTFTYCLIVLRTIRGGEDSEFIPSLAVAFGFALAIVGVGVLIVFIHHIASSIQASSIIASVAEETVHAVDRMFPEKPDEEEQGYSDDRVDLSAWRWHHIAASRSGYVQSVDRAALLRLAKEQSTIVRMERGVGDFVVRNTQLVSVAQETLPDPSAIDDLRAAFSISRHRTVEQDPGFGIRQLVDVALKALSPGVNDTTTAMTCTDYLAAILARLAPRHVPSPLRYQDGALRVIADGPDFESLLAEAFDPIRASAKGNLEMILCLLRALELLARLTSSPRRRRALEEQTERIDELAERTIESVHERARIQVQLGRVRAALEAEPVVCAGLRTDQGPP